MEQLIISGFNVILVVGVAFLLGIIICNIGRMLE